MKDLFSICVYIRSLHNCFFEDLSEQVLLKLCRCLKIVKVLDGDSIVTCGDSGSQFYIIIAGTAKVTTRKQELTKLKIGDSFGELAIVTDSRTRTASVIAVSSCELVYLDKYNYNITLSQERERILAEKITFLSNIPLFSGRPRKDLAQLVSVVHEERYAVGQVICTESRKAMRVAFVKSGMVATYGITFSINSDPGLLFDAIVSKRQPKMHLLERLRKCDCILEYGYLEHQPSNRESTRDRWNTNFEKLVQKAVTKTTVLSIPLDDLNSFVSPNDRLALSEALQRRRDRNYEALRCKDKVYVDQLRRHLDKTSH